MSTPLGPPRGGQEPIEARSDSDPRRPPGETASKPSPGEHTLNTPDMQGQMPPSEGQEFALHPFGLEAANMGLRLRGQLARRGNHLHIRYQLSGDVGSVVVPAPAAGGPKRTDGLWEHTCFELFLAAEGAQPYWEVNLAPSGHWNLYRLEGYRQGLKAEPDREALPFTVSYRSGELELTLDLVLPQELALACRARPLRLAATAVLEQRDGTLSYWALAHGGPEADFHRREDFLLRLEP